MPQELTIGQRWRDYRPSKVLWFWSCVAVIILTMIVGFSWGGWVTGSTAAQQASNAADQARAQLAADLCVARFDKAPDFAVKLASLKKTDEWQRSDFITQGGWVTLPGQKQPVSGAADLCVQQLMSAKPLATAKAS